ncbi:MAG: cytochrome d ubiquinol oxidase subunit II [Parvularculaceae bacterium]|nr:cytochrome d ubiquinol oxidase subunit II [Parvularculaceae bacterium]
MDFDALLLSRIQFAFVIAFHILFPAFTIGLAAFLAVRKGLRRKTTRDVFLGSRWTFSLSAIDFQKALLLAPAPIAALAITYLLWRDIRRGSAAPDWRPILYAASLFVTGFLGLAISLFPFNVPFAKTIWETAARDNALAFMLVGAAVMLPVILAYTAYVYRLFWGKVRADEGYHA